MPIYEYRCTECGAEFEYMQRISEPPKSDCEKCGASLERLISRSAFHLKGGGWYKDLYASPKPSDGKAAEAKGGESKGGESKGGESKGGESKGGESKGSGGAGSSTKTSAGSGD